MAVEIGPAPTEQREEQPAIGLSWRALLLSIIFCFIASFWIADSEVVKRFCQITEAVPAVPAVAFLILLVVLNPLVRRISEYLSLDRREVLMVYVFLTVATSMAGCGIARFFINTIPVPFYYATPENNFESVQEYIPDWFVPHDAETLRLLYEASEEGNIVWGPWLKPLAAWGLFFLALWITMMAMVVILRRQWSEKEKLTYPLLYLPVEVTEGLNTRAMVVDFFRSPVMWTGFAIAALYNIGNIINAYNPGFTALGKYYDMGALFTERPWSAIRPLTLHYRPEMVGFGYLVSTEVALSIWVFYFLLRLEAVAAAAGGLDIAGFPFVQEQGLGAYLAMAIFLLWIARGHLADVLRKAFGRAPEVRDDDEPMSYRTAVVAFVIGLAVVLAWVSYAGMALWLAVLYFALLLAVALVYARIRAEVGIPLIWMFPYYQHYKAIKYTLGSEPLQKYGGWGSLTIFTSLVFLSRGYYPSLIGYQAEGFRIARETNIRQRSMSWLLIIALVVGFYVAIWLHLRAYYMYGSGGLSALGGWGYGIANSEFEALTSYTKGHATPDVWRIGATAAGFVLTAALTIIRMTFLRFPLHPLAFGMAGSYGSLIWGSFFIVWVVKTIVFKLGGMSAYRRLIPGFLGLALGHYFTAGIVWGLIGLTLGESTHTYYVFFG
ncbi:MAG: DUF6785 family protein [Armatimonadota bacterium]|nr:DUF6785 family protein [Armatimonadota bacterium]